MKELNNWLVISNMHANCFDLDFQSISISMSEFTSEIKRWAWSSFVPQMVIFLHVGFRAKCILGNAIINYEAFILKDWRKHFIAFCHSKPVSCENILCKQELNGFFGSSFTFRAHLFQAILEEFHSTFGCIFAILIQIIKNYQVIKINMRVVLSILPRCFRLSCLSSMLF